MAGAGYKLFNTGDVLTAAQVNTYLQEQTVMVFANSTARTTALSGVLAEGMMSYLQDTNAVEVYNGTAWTAVGGGGLSSPLTTKGDVWGYSTTNARIPVGSNGTVLTADSAETLGVKWAAPAGGGKVLQVVGATTTTSTVIASTTYTDTTITATITPTSASSKIMVFVNGYAYLYRGSNEMAIGLKLVRGATDIYTNTFAFYPAIVGATSIEFNSFYPVMYLDSPATTSATTYKIQGKVSATSSGGSSTWQSGSVASTITLMEIGA